VDGKNITGNTECQYKFEASITEQRIGVKGKGNRMKKVNVENEVIFESGEKS